ncbi:hypothetical protein CEQ90_11665 [Lewinellaceae bacterium SD302]|nr:hypothetical protein CEQ90_11665 [Lewinellaceae bacterium SD302]
MHYLDYELIRQPISPEGDDGLMKIGSSDLLVVYPAGDERAVFLNAILKAAGFDAVAEQVSTLCPADEQADIDLSALLLCQPKIRRIMIFGISGKRLGLHFLVSNYAPIVVNEKTYLFADDLSVIQSEKAAGNARKAGALWQAVKAAFKNT